MEFVFVIPRRALFPDRVPQGFVPFGRPARAAAGGELATEVMTAEVMAAEGFAEAVCKHGFFVERARAEVEPDWKQVIPYNVVVAGEEILLLRRTSKGGESRLHDKLSIGVGGHVEPQDLEGASGGRVPADAADSRASLLARGSDRELAEELEIHGAHEIEPIGLINDDSNPVGAVHVGLAQIVRVTGSVAIREKHVLEGRLARLDELRALRREGANFESWSALLVDALIAGRLPALPAFRPRVPNHPAPAAGLAQAAAAEPPSVHGGAGASNAPRR